MPHIRAHGVDKSMLENVAQEMITTVAKATETPTDHFTLEYVASDFLVFGGASPAYPFIEILWFDRGQQVKSAVANIVDDILRPHIESGCDITVLFRDLEGKDYFENKVHF